MQIKNDVFAQQLRTNLAQLWMETYHLATQHQIARVRCLAMVSTDIFTNTDQIFTDMTF